jgi:enoyl-CoA hydratase
VRGVGALTRTTDHGGIRVVALDRPPVNAIDREAIAAIRAAVADAAGAASCRALVLTGSGRAFSAGIDVNLVPRYDAATRADMIREIDRTMLALYGFPKPTVAAVNGHALGGGLVVALACDFRLAAAGTYRLGLTEAAAGIPFPAVPMLVVGAELDPDTARRMTLASAVFGPTDALAARFLDAVHPPDRLLAEAIACAEAALAAPAYAAVKRQLRGDALARMRRIVDEDLDPMARSTAEEDR